MPSAVARWPLPLNPSAPQTVEWMYNEIMRHIEPDLLTNVLPQLSEYYAGESAIERHARFSSYQRAFRAFDAACAAIDARHQDALTGMRQSAVDILSQFDDAANLPSL